VTTRRELVILPGGALLIDTPGMRELQMWGGEEGLRATFEDIEELAGRCRFGDCRHEAEPDCAVRAALSDGTLDPDRLRSYHKLQREVHHLEIRQDRKLRLDEKRRWKRSCKRSRDRDHLRRMGLVR
jgi:ribosome biogenesis GTPase